MTEESTDPVELVGRAFEAGNRRDLDAVAGSFAEDATFDGRGLGDRFEGRAAIRSFLGEWFGTYEELEIGLNGVAAPVHDATGKVIAAVGVSGPSHRLSPDTFPTVAARLLVGAREIGARLGYFERPPHHMQ